MSDPLFLKRVIARREKGAQSLRSIIERHKLSQYVPIVSVATTMFERLPIDTAAQLIQDLAYLWPDLRLFNVHLLDDTVANIKEELQRITDSIDDIVDVYRGMSSIIALAHSKRDPNEPPPLEPPAPDDYATVDSASRRFLMIAQHIMRTSPYQESIVAYLQQLAYTEQQIWNDPPPVNNTQPTTGIFAPKDDDTFITGQTETPVLDQKPLEPETASKTLPTP